MKQRDGVFKKIDFVQDEKGFQIGDPNGTWKTRLTVGDVEQLFLAIAHHFPAYAQSKEADFVARFAFMAMQLDTLMNMGIDTLKVLAEQHKNDSPIIRLR